MTDRVSQFLLDEGLITSEQYQQARRTMEFFGGPLDGHLLKLGFLREDTLGKALASLCGCAYAGAAQLRIVDPMVAALLSVELVEEFRVCPFRREGDVLRVAMLNPRDAVGIRRIESATRLKVEPWVTSNYRLNLALERHYHVRQRQARALSLGPQSTEEEALSQAERQPEVEPSAGNTEPWGADIGLDGRPLDAEITLDHLARSGAADFLDPAPAEGPGDPGDLDSVGKALAAAVSVPEINDRILDYCACKTTRCALFGLTAEGFKRSGGRGRSLGSERAGKTVIPSGAGHLLDEVLDSGNSFYLGAVPPLPANRDLYSLLGGNLPPAAMVLPIRVRGRTVALLYLDNDSDPIETPDVPAMRRLAAKAGLAYELLLLRRKLEEL